MALDTEGGSLGRMGLVEFAVATEAFELAGAAGAWAMVSAKDSYKQHNKRAA
jgi:hypothetical protein